MRGIWRRPKGRARSGLTLIELLVAIVFFGLTGTLLLARLAPTKGEEAVSAPAPDDAVVTADTKPTAYALQVHEHRTGAYSSFFTLRLYNRATGRAVWKRTVRGYNDTAGDFKGWSSDRRALALPVQPFTWPRETILFWRAGHKIWLCPRQRGGQSHDDYEFGQFVWSKDKSRVLFRGGASGDADVDVGTLYCANVRRRKLHRIAYAVRKMEWVSKNTVRYWPVSGFDEKSRMMIVSPHFRTWRCP